MLAVFPSWYYFFNPPLSFKYWLPVSASICYGNPNEVSLPFFFIKILFSSTSYLLVFFVVSFYVSLYSVFPVHLWACIDRVKSYFFVVNHFTDDCFPSYLMSSSWQLKNKRHVTGPVPTLLPPWPNCSPSCLHVTFYQLSVKSQSG